MVLPAVILAVLGYHSLRQWERSAETLFRAQARDLASMTAEKVDMVLRHAEDEIVARLLGVLAGPRPAPEALRAFVASTPLIKGLSVFDRRGTSSLPPSGAGRGQALFPILSRAFPPAVWDRPGVHRLAVPDQIHSGRRPRGAGGGALLTALSLDPEALRRDLLEKTLGPQKDPPSLPCWIFRAVR